MAVPDLVTTPLGDRWALQVRELCESGAIGALVRELAMQAQCLALDDAATPARGAARRARNPAQRGQRRQAAGRALRRRWAGRCSLQLEAGVAEDSPARRDAAERARRQAEAEQIIHDDPLVQALMAQYKTARIVPGSVKPH